MTFTIDLLWKEWIGNLGLRRAFFLEYDHYKERRDELNDVARLKDIPEDIRHQTRHPWLPHPELRETVPNVSLYTCIYQLPSHIETDLPDNASDLERQLSAAVRFFDQCLPTPPGFSSSVVAITILPEPAIVAQAWKKWYYCGKKLRQLRYIRRRINLLVERQKAAEEWVVDTNLPGGAAAKKLDLDPTATGSGMIARIESEAHDAVILEDSTQGKRQSLMPDFSQCLGDVTPITTITKDEATSDSWAKAAESHLQTGMAVLTGPLLSPAPGSGPMNTQNPSFKYAEFDVEECAEGIGLSEEAELGNLVSGIGIEQLSVYAREYAQR